MFGARLLDQGTPPSAAGVEGCAVSGEQRHWASDGEHHAGVRQSVDDNCGMTKRYLLDVQGLPRFQFVQYLRRGREMASDTEDVESAADRLEAALERIAEAAARGQAGPEDQLPSAVSKEIAGRLDALIDRLRTALANRAS